VSPFTIAVDDEVALRLTAESDATRLYVLIEQDRERLGAWLPWADSQTEEATRAFILNRRHAFADMSSVLFTIVYMGHVAGCIELSLQRSSDGVGTIGYWLGAAYEGHGVMTRACRALVDFAFGELGLRRLELLAATENRRSRAIPERLGFTLEGVAREAVVLRGRPADQAQYSLLAQEWEPTSG
jgi:ribosomal-protein-serine acetyltransferase